MTAGRDLIELKEQLDFVAHLLEVEKREHEETKGYRQHAEQLLADERARAEEALAQRDRWRDEALMRPRGDGK